MIKRQRMQDGEETQSNRFSIEISYSRGGASVIVCDAVGVCEADSLHVRIITKRGGLLIVGRRLSVATLYDSSLEISGIIYEMKFGKRAGEGV